MIAVKVMALMKLPFGLCSGKIWPPPQKEIPHAYHFKYYNVSQVFSPLLISHLTETDWGCSMYSPN